MASSLENNKILAAVLTAGIMASGAGVMSRIIYNPTTPTEPAYVIEVPDDAGGGGGGEGGGEELSVAALLATGDVAGGESGAKKCVSCHTFEDGGENKIGPNLYGLLGRDIASVSGFAYSDALNGIDGAWDYDSLDAFLADPKGYAPGTKMAYAGMKSGQDRADLILYLRSLAADPLPLPEAEAVEPDAAGETEGGAGEMEGGESEGEADASAEGEEAEASEDVAETEADADVADEVAEGAEEAADTAAEAAEEVVEGAEETATEAAETVADAADATAQAAGDTAEDAVEGAAEEASDAAAAVSDAAEDAEDVAVADAAADAGDAADAAAEGAAEVAEDAADAAEETVAAAGDAASDAATAAEGAAGAAAGGLLAMIAEGDVAKGEKVSKKCKACHVFEEGGKNKLGPALWGIVGKDIASHEGFNYSGALSELEGEWSYEALDQFLAAPKTYVPGTKMVFAGVKKEQDRADLIAYLRSLAAEPAPLN